MSFIKIMILIFLLNDCDLYSLYSWYDFYAILCIHEIFISSPNYFFSIFLKWWYECMRYSWIYFDVCKWEVSIMHGRMQCDKLIPWWFEIFMIWNDAYAFFMMCIMNALNDKCLESWLKWSDKYLKNIDLMFGIMNTPLSYMKIVINILK